MKHVTMFFVKDFLWFLILAIFIAIGAGLVIGGFGWLATGKFATLCRMSILWSYIILVILGFILNSYRHISHVFLYGKLSKRWNVKWKEVDHSLFKLKFRNEKGYENWTIEEYQARMAAKEMVGTISNMMMKSFEKRFGFKMSKI